MASEPGLKGAWHCASSLEPADQECAPGGARAQPAQRDGEGAAGHRAPGGLRAAGEEPGAIHIYVIYIGTYIYIFVIYRYIYYIDICYIYIYIHIIVPVCFMESGCALGDGVPPRDLLRRGGVHQERGPRGAGQRRGAHAHAEGLRAGGPVLGTKCGCLSGLEIGLLRGIRGAKLASEEAKNKQEAASDRKSRLLTKASHLPQERLERRKGAPFTCDLKAMYKKRHCARRI